MKILVAEDQAVLAIMLEDELLGAGHQVVGLASTANQALLIAQGNRPDLALLDATLGDGPSGIELARELRRRFGTWSILISGDPEPATGARDVAAGFIAKPFPLATLLGAIDTVGAIMSGRVLSSVPFEFELFMKQPR